MNFPWEEFIFSVGDLCVKISRTWMKITVWEGISTDEHGGGSWEGKNGDKGKAELQSSGAWEGSHCDIPYN